MKNDIRSQIINDSLQQHPDGPWHFDFILTPAEFKSLFDASTGITHKTLSRQQKAMWWMCAAVLFFIMILIILHFRKHVS